MAPYRMSACKFGNGCGVAARGGLFHCAFCMFDRMPEAEKHKLRKGTMTVTIMEQDDEWKNSPGKKKKTLRLQYRIRPDARRFWHFGDLADWTPYHRKYRTDAEREMAMNVMNRKDTLFEYRLPPSESKAPE